jgi:HupE / UreJ protein
MLVAVGVFAPPAATAHPLNTSTVELEVGKNRVAGEVRLPIDQLAAALERPITVADAEGRLLPSIRHYVSSHIAAEGADGTAWDVRVGGGRAEHGSRVDELVLDLSLTPPSGEVTDFSLTYDVITERLITHKAIAVLRSDGGDSTRTLGAFGLTRRTLEVDSGSVSRVEELTTATELGIEHIAEGADHLLFLLMLLLPAPLMIRNHRWVRCDDAWRSVRRVVHVVTAFAIGHSITLALAGVGLIHVPSGPVESLIALSILVASIHVIRPLITGGEVVFAVGFGLVHGLAFASLLGELDLDRGSLVFSLLGFNLGIELTQLFVVALLMPSLYLLSRTAVYTPFRIGGGVLGILLAGSWLLERTTLTSTDPFESFTTGLVEHPFLFSAGMAVFATAAYVLSSPEGRSRGRYVPPTP